MKTNYSEKVNDIIRFWYVPVFLGFISIFLGLGIVFIPDLKLLATVISGFMFLSGLLRIIYIYVNVKQFDGWGFYLILAILDFILGILLMTTPEIKTTTISIILSFGVLFQGLDKIIYSLDVQKLGIRNWDLDLLTGVLFVTYGAMSIFLLSLSPVFILLTTALIIAFSGFFRILLALGRQAEYSHDTREVKVESMQNI